MTPSKSEDQLVVFGLIQDFKEDIAKAFVKEAGLRSKKSQLEKELAKVNARLNKKTSVKAVFDDPKYSSLTKQTMEALLEQVSEEAPKPRRKSKSLRMGRPQKLKLLQKAVGGRAEWKLAELRDALGVSNVNQWLGGLGLPKGAVESLGSKKAGSKLIVSKIKHLFAV